MRRQFTSFALIICGALALALGMVVAPAPTPATAGPALQPSPRPTLAPTADSIPDDNDDAPAAMGRITGTVIDSRTGAPAPGRAVQLGDRVVVSDASGNYDQWLPPGSYTVALQLREGEVAASGAQLATISPDGTTVLHLFFSSPAPMPAPTLAPPTPEAAPQQAAAPVAQATAALPTPVASIAPAAPADLPETSVAAAQPTALPSTADGDVAQAASLVAAGGLLLAAGVALQLRPRRHPARVPVARAPRQSADELLEELLRS